MATMESPATPTPMEDSPTPVHTERKRKKWWKLFTKSNRNNSPSPLLAPSINDGQHLASTTATPTPISAPNDKFSETLVRRPQTLKSSAVVQRSITYHPATKRDISFPASIGSQRLSLKGMPVQDAIMEDEEEANERDKMDIKQVIQEFRAIQADAETPKSSKKRFFFGIKPKTPKDDAAVCVASTSSTDVVASLLNGGNVNDPTALKTDAGVDEISQRLQHLVSDNNCDSEIKTPASLVKNFSAISKKIKDPAPAARAIAALGLPPNGYKSLQEDQEKHQKRQNILSILRGHHRLPVAFRRKYRLCEVLGDGAFGYVFAAKIINDAQKREFIIKERVPASAWVFDENGWVPYEAHLLHNMRHPNIIQFLDVYHDDKYVIMVTELHGCEWRTNNPLLNPVLNPGLREHRGESFTLPDKPISAMTDDELLQRRRTACDLFECIDAHRRVPESTAKLIFLQIVNAVEYLHSLGFVHRDLKDENVVIDEKYNVKLIDFGSTTRMPAADDYANYFSLFNGTLHFAAPEILQGNTYRGPEAEVWALGVLLYTLMYGENPFQTPEDIVDMKIRYPSKPELCVDLIKKIFTPDEKKRVTLAQIKAHPWLHDATSAENETNA